MTKEKAVTIRIDEELYEKLKDKADKDQRTVSSAIRFAIQNYIEN